MVRERRRPQPPVPEEEEVGHVDHDNVQDFIQHYMEEFQHCPVALPADIAERLRYLSQFRASGPGATWAPDIDRYVCRTARQAKLAGMTHFQIAQNLQMHVRAIPALMKRAMEQAKEQFLHNDPSTDFIEAIERFDTVQQQAVRLIVAPRPGTTLSPKELKQLEGIITNCEKGKLLVKEAYGYFDTINYARLTDRGSGGSSREGLKRLREALNRIRESDGGG